MNSDISFPLKHIIDLGSIWTFQGWNRVGLCSRSPKVWLKGTVQDRPKLITRRGAEGAGEMAGRHIAITWCCLPNLHHKHQSVKERQHGGGNNEIDPLQPLIHLSTHDYFWRRMESILSPLPGETQKENTKVFQAWHTGGRKTLRGSQSIHQSIKKSKNKKNKSPLYTLLFCFCLWTLTSLRRITGVC